MFLVAPRSHLLEHAALLAGKQFGPLDAIHLASARFVSPSEFAAYDRRLLTAAAEAGLTAVSPGA